MQSVTKYNNVGLTILGKYRRAQIYIPDNLGFHCNLQVTKSSMYRNILEGITEPKVTD